MTKNKLKNYILEPSRVKDSPLVISDGSGNLNLITKFFGIYKKAYFIGLLVSVISYALIFVGIPMYYSKSLVFIIFWSFGLGFLIPYLLGFLLLMFGYEVII